MGLKKEEEEKLLYGGWIHLKLWIIDDSLGNIFLLDLNLIKYMIIGYIYKPAKPTQGDFSNIVNTTG